MFMGGPELEFEWDANPTVSEVVPGRREAASPEPITAALGGMDSGLACCARARNDARKDLLTQQD